jgi:hypothetical protein
MCAGLATAARRFFCSAAGGAPLARPTLTSPVRYLSLPHEIRRRGGAHASFLRGGEAVAQDFDSFSFRPAPACPAHPHLFTFVDNAGRCVALAPQPFLSLERLCCAALDPERPFFFPLPLFLPSSVSQAPHVGRPRRSCVPRRPPSRSALPALDLTFFAAVALPTPPGASFHSKDNRTGGCAGHSGLPCHFRGVLAGKGRGRPQR